MTMEWYSAHVEAQAPPGVPEPTPDDAAADALMDLLADYDGIVSLGAGSWSATVSVRADSAPNAVTSAADLIGRLAERAGLPGWPTVRAEAVRQDVLDAANMRPTLPEMVSAPEAAEILAVSPQRLHELAAGHQGFPEPVYELRTGRLWLRAGIEAFAQRWERRPGRPPKAAAGIR